jgi:hypothetical protein
LIITKHAMVRYLQRIKGIKDEHEANEFLDKNESIIKLELLELYERSKLLIENFRMTYEHENCSYYFYNNMLLLILCPENNKQTLVTVYSLEFKNCEIGNNDLGKFEDYVKTLNIKTQLHTKAKKRQRENDITSRQLEGVVEYLKCQLEEYELKLEESVEKSKEICMECKSLKEEIHRIMSDISFNYFKKE